MVVPQRSPLELANSLASLDQLSGGRLTVGVGVGWSEGEYAALGRSFADRGARLDEALDLWRVVWRDDPATFEGRFTSFRDLRVLPQPAHEIPVWVGGSSARARRRGIERGDGFHLIGLTPDQAVAPIAELRAARPEPDFRISLRTGWDPQGMEPDRIRAEHEAYATAGIDYVVAAPWQTDLDAAPLEGAARRLGDSRPPLAPRRSHTRRGGRQNPPVLPGSGSRADHLDAPGRTASRMRHRRTIASRATPRRVDHGRCRPPRSRGHEADHAGCSRSWAA